MWEITWLKKQLKLDNQAHSALFLFLFLFFFLAISILFVDCEVSLKPLLENLVSCCTSYGQLHWDHFVPTIESLILEEKKRKCTQSDFAFFHGEEPYTAW